MLRRSQFKCQRQQIFIKDPKPFKSETCLWIQFYETWFFKMLKLKIIWKNESQRRGSKKWNSWFIHLVAPSLLCDAALLTFLIDFLERLHFCSGGLGMTASFLVVALCTEQVPFVSVKLGLLAFILLWTSPGEHVGPADVPSSISGVGVPWADIAWGRSSDGFSRRGFFTSGSFDLSISSMLSRLRLGRFWLSWKDAGWSFRFSQETKR